MYWMLWKRKTPLGHPSMPKVEGSRPIYNDNAALQKTKLLFPTVTLDWVLLGCVKWWSSEHVDVEIDSGPFRDRKSKQFRPKVINLKAADFLKWKSAVVGASALSQTRWPRAWRSIANGGLTSATDVIHRQPKLLHHVAIQSGPCEAVLALTRVLTA